MNAILKYPGAKWGLSKWILSFFPDHHSYLEPFFWSGAVFFHKPSSDIETINDLDGNVVNFFACIRQDPERLAREIAFLPYARSIYEKAFSEEPEDPFDRAVNFCVRLNMSHGFRTNGEKVGWKNDVHGRERAYAVKEWNALPQCIMEAAERLKEAQIEQMDAVQLIRRFNHKDVLIYCDPPYVLQKRHGKQYRCEMDDSEHSQLLDALLKHQGAAIISGYENDLYSDKLRSWHKEKTTAYSQIASRKEEVLWMNFEPIRQLSFFEDGGERHG